MRRNKAWTGSAAGTAPSRPGTCSARPAPPQPNGGSRNAPRPSKASPSRSTKPGTGHDQSPPPRQPAANAGGPEAKPASGAQITGHRAATGQAAVTHAGQDLQDRTGAQGPRRRPGSHRRDLAVVPQPAGDPAPG